MARRIVCLASFLLAGAILSPVAAQGPRTQADRRLYRTAIRRALEAANLVLLGGEAVDLLVHSGRAAGVRLEEQ